VSLERLWAGWRSEYVEGAAKAEGCVFCRILASNESGETTYVVRRDDRCAVVLNAYPYTSGHLMVMPVRHVAELEDLDAEEGAALWAGVTVLTGYQIGWMAVGVGAMVGVAVRTAGRGTTKAFGILGAVLALGGCLVGNFLTGVVVLSRHWDISFATFFTRLTPELTSRMMTAMFSPLDLLFYALALWQGYKFAIVATTE